VKRLDRELAQRAQGVAAGGDIPVLVTAMQDKQRQRETAAATVDRLEGLEKAAEVFDVGAWVEGRASYSGHAGGRSCRQPRLPP
jgi:hypothetical protein